MLRQSLLRPSFTRTVLRVFAFNTNYCSGRKAVKWMQMHRHHSCILFHKPVKCFERKNKQWFSDNPSCIRITLPALTPTMETGTIVKWYKKEGEKLNEGDALADIETDKATIAFESPYEGYLAKILLPEGTKNVAVGQLLCVIVENEADIGNLKEECYAVQAPALEVTPAVTAEPPVAVVPVQPPVASTPAEPAPIPSLPTVSPSADKRVLASPLAVKLATENGINLKTLPQGTGIWNSIKAADLQKAHPGPAAVAAVSAPGHRQQLVTGKASAISMDLANSKKTVPHFYLVVDININKISAFCEKFNMDLKTDLELGIRDFILKAAAHSCIAVPETNSLWMDTFIREYKSVNINVAVYLPSGLVMPVMLDTEKRTISEINKNVEALIQKGREQRLEPKDMEVGTFTVVYMGKYNISTFAPIIRPPQSCALAVGATEKRISPIKNVTDMYKVDEFVTATLSCDHRVVDGHRGAEWLQRFKQLLENPESMLL